MVNNFSIIHPSRGRAALAHETAMRWITTAVNQSFEYILSVDIDDPQLPVYRTLFEKTRFKVVVNRNSNVVQAMNYGAQFVSNDIIIGISDDMMPIDKWDEKIANEITEDVQALQVRDGIVNKPNSAYVQKYGKPELIMTLPILTKQLYLKLGYIYYPAYTGMFADNDLAECCNHLGVLKQSNLEFEHVHFTNGKTSIDNTYRRHNTKSSWILGEQIIKRRREQSYNFANE
jgi:glycosyltransferase involved in cell wall biosynthesis